MRKKEGQKDKDILQAAVKVFAEAGYHRAKISKIAELAGVATGSVYVYFQNKEDILHKIFDSLWKQLYGGLEEIVEKEKLSPGERIDAMIDLVFDVFTENPDLASVFVNEQYHLLQSSPQDFTRYHEKFLDNGQVVISEGIKKGIFAEEIDLDIFRYYILGALRSLLHRWVQEPDKYSLNRIRTGMKYLTKHGLMKI